ncbi:MAG TPA: hypothetical protein VHP36_00210 [Chitinispirillaceae bacterium]|nr:hypothetical protein [Chitinispirillaceae bacterium]
MFNVVRNCKTVVLGLSSCMLFASAMPSLAKEEFLTFSNTDFYASDNCFTANLYCDWTYSGLEPLYNGKAIKTITLGGRPYTGGNVYITVLSKAQGSGADSYLMYQKDGQWLKLSDDEGGARDFLAVVHFNGYKDPQYFQGLGFTHYDSSDHNSFRVFQIMKSYNPDEHGCYYLEIYPDGRIEKVWHP